MKDKIIIGTVLWLLCVGAYKTVEMGVYLFKHLDLHVVWK